MTNTIENYVSDLSNEELEVLFVEVTQWEKEGVLPLEAKTREIHNEFFNGNIQMLNHIPTFIYREIAKRSFSPVKSNPANSTLVVFKGKSNSTQYSQIRFFEEWSLEMHYPNALIPTKGSYVQFEKDGAVINGCVETVSTIANLDTGSFSYKIELSYAYYTKSPNEL